MKSCPTCKRTYPDDTLAFCLEDGSVLSAPYDSEQTLRIPSPRVTDPPPTQMAPRASHAAQSTIHAPAPNFPPLHQSNQQTIDADSPKTSLIPWLLISGAILVVGIFGVWMIVSRLPSSPEAKRNGPAPSPTVVAKSNSMCGQEVSAAIFEKWTEMGGQAGKLGCPINQQTDAPTSPNGSVGRWIQFEKGDGGYLIENTRSAFGAPLANGKAVEVTGCMFKLYSSLGGTKSWLGFPIGDGRETATGAQQNFESGYIEWNSKNFECRPRPNAGIGSGSGDGTK